VRLPRCPGGTVGSRRSSVRVGSFPRAGVPPALAADRRRFTAAAHAAGVDHLGVGDHVSFFVGAGQDGLVDAASLLSVQDDLPVYVGAYLLPLRHPVIVARSLATIAQIAPGRLTLGVGIGGEDRHEIEVCGVDPRTRGRRMDESLTLLRALLRGEPATLQGEFIDVRDALILPSPDPPIRITVAGRSGAAVRRAALLGDGWLGIWVSPRRYAAVSEEIADLAIGAGREPSGFEHALNVWCGFGETAEAARPPLATSMEAFYAMPFTAFERYSPFGRPEDVAAFLAPYAEAGCAAFNLIPCAADLDEALEGAGEVRRLLAGARSDRAATG
jgi:alkanesulfonate monooxygenase SsuD/methylene tetrahydromethanopterin reductase-like flavin-dependent oxidoreductase (luciferase family)